jgi:hypothetical protein
MAVRYKKNRYTLAVVKLDSFTDTTIKEAFSAKMWTDTSLYYYDRITTQDSGNVKVKIYNDQLRVEYGRLVYWSTLLFKWEIEPKNFGTILPGDGLIGDIDDGVVSFRVDMYESFFRDEYGGDINLKKDGYFTASFKLPDYQVVKPDSLSMWHFDETNCRWTFETYAHRNGDSYVANLNKFGWWTSFRHDCEFRKINLKLNDEYENPLPYAELLLVSKKTKRENVISTDAMGECTLFIDKNDSYEVYLKGFSVVTSDHSWPFSQSFTNIKIQDDNELFCVIETGDDDRELKCQLKKKIEAIYQNNGLSYSDLHQRTQVENDHLAVHPAEEIVEEDLYDGEIQAVEAYDTYEKKEDLFTANKSHRYPNTVLMPEIGGIHYGKIHYGQTWMSKWILCRA